MTKGFIKMNISMTPKQAFAFAEDLRLLQEEIRRNSLPISDRWSAKDSLNEEAQKGFDIN
jgi:hypothetical protein